MRKSIAILLLIVFNLSLYARQVIFWECKISNLLKSAASQCDCEKKAGFTQQPADPQPLSQSHTHGQANEYFFRSGEQELITCYRLSCNSPAMTKAPALPEAALPGPWQPPNS